MVMSLIDNLLDWINRQRGIDNQTPIPPPVKSWHRGPVLADVIEFYRDYPENRQFIPAATREDGQTLYAYLIRRPPSKEHPQADRLPYMLPADGWADFGEPVFREWVETLRPNLKEILDTWPDPTKIGPVEFTPSQ